MGFLNWRQFGTSGNTGLQQTALHALPNFFTSLFLGRAKAPVPIEHSTKAFLAVLAFVADCFHARVIAA